MVVLPRPTSPTSRSGRVLLVWNPAGLPSRVVPMRTSMSGEATQPAADRTPQQQLISASSVSDRQRRGSCGSGGVPAEVEARLGQCPGHRSGRGMDVGETDAAVDAVGRAAVVVAEDLAVSDVDRDVAHTVAAVVGNDRADGR